MSTALGSGAETKLRVVLALPIGQPVEAGFPAALAKMGPFSVDAASFRQIDGDTASVRVTSRGSTAAWKATLIWTDAKAWQIALTSAAG